MKISLKTLKMLGLNEKRPHTECARLFFGESNKKNLIQLLSHQFIFDINASFISNLYQLNVTNLFFDFRSLLFF